MKKLLALLFCVTFVLSVSSFAFWGIGGNKQAETKAATCETKCAVKKVATKKIGVKKAVVVKKMIKKAKVKKAAPVVPSKK